MGKKDLEECIINSCFEWNYLIKVYLTNSKKKRWIEEHFMRNEINYLEEQKNTSFCEICKPKIDYFNINNKKIRIGFSDKEYWFYKNVIKIDSKSLIKKTYKLFTYRGIENLEVKDILLLKRAEELLQDDLELNLMVCENCKDNKIGENYLEGKIKDKLITYLPHIEIKKEDYSVSKSKIEPYYLPKA